MTPLRVAALAGGVGGAKLANGLARCLAPDLLTVIVNTGDDFDHLGLRICPDIDTVVYTLAGLANPVSGWGRDGESWQALETIRQLGGPDWFQLGDRDIGLHLTRTQLLRSGQPLSQVTRRICQALSVDHLVIPATDDPVPTLVHTDTGVLSFQEYFVHLRCEPRVRAFEFAGSTDSVPAPGVLEAIEAADVIILCPSNPWVSIDPIFSIPGIYTAAARKPVVAVSPIIGAKTLKGPAAKMFAELGIAPSARAVAEHYRSMIRGFVLHHTDAGEGAEIEQWGIISLATDVIMPDLAGQQRLAAETLAFAEKILGG